MGDVANFESQPEDGKEDLSPTLSVSQQRLHDEEEDAGKCGYGSCTPRYLQKFHKPPWLLAALCFMVIIQGFIVTGLMGSVISTLERRFHLNSKETGLIATTYDISVALVLIPVTYYGGFQHKGKWLGYGCVVMGIGSFVMVIPQFATGLYKYTSTDLRFCSGSTTNQTNITCLNEENLSDYLYVFILAQFLIGLGASPMFSLTFVYLDENLSRDSSALYVGIFYCVSLLGPALGFLLGGYFLNTYGDVGYVDVKSLDITKDDPQWYGAWWFGYVICGILSFIAALPLLCFARELPGAEERRRASKKESDIRSDEDVVSQPGFGLKLKDLPVALKSLFKIPTFVLLALCDSFEGLAAGGAAAFMPKYIETQFGLSSSLSSITSGAIMIPAGGGGAILGGIIIKKLKLSCPGIMKLCIGTLTLSALSSIALLASCPNRNIAGVTVPYPQDSRLSSTSSCISNCGCSFYGYEPVCGDDKMEFLTPCFAGCKNITEREEASCSCTNGTYTTLKSGTCPATCTLLPLFLAALFCIIFFGFVASTPTVQATMRCVPFKQRSLATGVSWIFVRCLGSIPSPLMFGALLDGVCLKWGERCGEQTSCQIYANEEASYRVLGGILTSKAFAVFFMVLAYKFYRPPSVLVSLEKEISPGETNQGFDLNGTKDSVVKL